MSIATFHRVTAGSSAVRPDDIFYAGQVRDFFSKGVDDQHGEYELEKTERMLRGSDSKTCSDLALFNDIQLKFLQDLQYFGPSLA